MGERDLVQQSRGTSLVTHETCQEYVSRRLSKGWRIISRSGFNVILQSPDGILKIIDLRNDIETLRPNAAGTYTQLTPYPGAGEANWQDVDDITPDEDSTYVYGLSVNDTYNLSDHVAGTGSIYGVTIYVRAKYVTEPIYIYIKIRTESYNYTSYPYMPSLTDSYADYSKLWTNNPATGVAWTWAEIDALEAGIIFNGNTITSRCTQVYVEVEYGPALTPTATTQAVTSVDKTTATGNGTIVSNGGDIITEKGICYKVGTSGDPTTADSTQHDHVDSVGAYTEAVTGLTAGTGYRFRAYAINSTGTGYGATVQVTTLSAGKTTLYTMGTGTIRIQ